MSDVAWLSVSRATCTQQVWPNRTHRGVAFCSRSAVGRRMESDAAYEAPGSVMESPFTGRETHGPSVRSASHNRDGPGPWGDQRVLAAPGHARRSADPLDPSFLSRGDRAALARRLGVARSTVTRALRRDRLPQRQLPADTVQAVLAILRVGAGAHGFPDDDWTAARVAEVLGRVGLARSPKYVPRILRAAGYAWVPPSVARIRGGTGRGRWVLAGHGPPRAQATPEPDGPAVSA